MLDSDTFKCLSELRKLNTKEITEPKTYFPPNIIEPTTNMKINRITLKNIVSLIFFCKSLYLPLTPLLYNIFVSFGETVIESSDCNNMRLNVKNVIMNPKNVIITSKKQLNHNVYSTPKYVLKYLLNIYK